MGIKLKNNAVSTIPLALSSTATNLTVASGQGARFPILGTGDYFYATISDTGNNFEIVKVTARFDDTMTVTRGQEGTLALPFAANSRIELRVTAQSVLDLVSFSVQNFTGTGSQVNFTMPTAISENSTNIYINGVYQQKNTYSVVNNVIIFTQAPPNTSTIEVMYA